jgi:hypothetical protein
VEKRGANNDYFIGSKDFIIPEVAMLSLCLFHVFIFFLEIHFEAPNEKKVLLRPE